LRYSLDQRRIEPAPLSASNHRFGERFLVPNGV
jgi:hypothetical protein